MLHSATNSIQQQWSQFCLLLGPKLQLITCMRPNPNVLHILARGSIELTCVCRCSVPSDKPDEEFTTDYSTADLDFDRHRARDRPATLIHSGGQLL
jgi:hypothetical protein